MYHLIKNLENLKKILNNYYLRNADKLRSEWLENSFKKWAKNKKKNNVSELSPEKEILASLINDEEISN